MEPQKRGADDTHSDDVTWRDHRVLATCTVLAGVVTAVLVTVSAATRPLWHDELYTLTFSRQGVDRGLWSALATGAEATPPGYLLLERASTALLGETAFALRFPSIIGFLLFSGTLYIYLRRRTTRICAATAAFLPLTTATIYYSQEARPYALVLGLTALALLLWISGTAAPEPRLPVIAALAVVNILAVSMHYAAVFLVLPLAAGEAVRSLRQRHVDPIVWSAIAAVGIPVALFFPLMKAINRGAQNFWAFASWQQIPAYSMWLLGRKGLLVCLIVGAAFLASRFISLRGSSATTIAAGAPSEHEIVTGAVLLILPAVLVGLALLLAKGFTERYAIISLIGYTAVAAWLLDRGASRWPRLPSAVLALCLVFSMAGGASLVLGARAAGRENDRRVDLLEEVMAPDTPIAVPNSVVFLEVAHAAPGKVLERLVYPADPARSLKHLGENSSEFGIIDVAKLTGLPVVPFSEFFSANCRFSILGSPDEDGWLLLELRAQRVPVTVVVERHGYVVSRVDRCASL